MDKGSGKYKFLLVLQVLTIVSFKILVTLDQCFERNHWMGKLFLSLFTVWKRFHLLVLSRLAGNIITFAPFFQLVIIIPFWAKPCPVRFWPFLDKNPFLLPTLADAQDANMILLSGKQPLFDGIICRTQHQNNLSRDDWNEGCWTSFFPSLDANAELVGCSTPLQLMRLRTLIKCMSSQFRINNRTDVHVPISIIAFPVFMSIVLVWRSGPERREEKHWTDWIISTVCREEMQQEAEYWRHHTIYMCLRIRLRHGICTK